MAILDRFVGRSRLQFQRQKQAGPQWLIGMRDSASGTHIVKMLPATDR
jgi:hypothetical protein